MKGFLKKSTSIVLVLSLVLCCFFSTVTHAKVGDVKGKAVHTDIVAYINHYAIPSYAANGQSCIVAEDLRNFGFDVVWNNNTRSLTISRNTNTTVKEMEVNKIEKTGTFFSNILETDISVYANGKKLTSYALNGYTMVPIEELTMFGNVYWVAGERAIKLWVDGLKIRDSKQIPETKKIGSPIGTSICVDGIGFYLNSVDGVHVYWQGKNNTGKTINYYTLYYSMYNPVGDPAYCTINDSYIVDNSIVGPVAPGENLLDYGVIGYTGACEYVCLDYIYVEYSDGTNEWIEYGYIGGETLWDKYNNPEIGLSIYN